MSPRTQDRTRHREAGGADRPAERLLSWYDRHRRDLPWRRSEDPFAIWVSEIMLQQTRVETAIPYYERFLERFPRLEDLAAADLEEVLGLWSGLGYYRRARHLHRAARQLVAAGRGIPEEVSALERLPGIGPYTAAAIGSIAFGVPVPAIDGNVERVVTRYRGLAGDPRRGDTRRRVERTARELLVEERPGDGNQALMELGATLCRPRDPLCHVCPLAVDCLARRRRDPESFPTPRVRRSTERVEWAVAVVRDRDRVLLIRRREESALLAGLWELPWIEGLGTVERPGGGPTELAADRFGVRYGGDWRIERSLGAVRHAITHRSLRIEILEARLDSAASVAEGETAGWFRSAEIDRLPTTSMVGKVLTKVGFLKRPD